MIKRYFVFDDSSNLFNINCIARLSKYRAIKNSLNIKDITKKLFILFLKLIELIIFVLYLIKNIIFNKYIELIALLINKSINNISSE